tara:strand:+ start:1427 stop:1954 length:528 start_codon:yes stop_codon:yes gene_type:complete
MKIYSNGASFAFGKYPEYLAESLNAELDNVSRPGYANRSIWRTTLECDPKKYDLAVIQLTTPSRTEFFDGKKWRQPSVSQPTSKFWQFYYENIYHDKMGEVWENMALFGIKDHFAIHNIPCIIVTTEVNPKNRNFDINLWDIKFPLDKTRHPTDLGHKMISKVILKHYEDIISGM